MSKLSYFMRPELKQDVVMEVPGSKHLKMKREIQYLSKLKDFRLLNKIKYVGCIVHEKWLRIKTESLSSQIPMR